MCSNERMLVILFLAGLSAGFIDAVAGGGGLIAVPALLFTGMPVPWVLGTNKLQSSCGTVIAVIRYWRAGLIKWHEVWLTMIFSFAFAMLGAWAVGHVSKDVLKVIVPWLLLSVAVYSLLCPSLGLEARRARMGPDSYSVLAGSTLGFYDGFFGPGAGSFWTISLLTLRGMELTRATGYTKIVNLASNVASLLIFLCAGTVHYGYGLVMIAGQLIGARLGSGMVLKHGALFVRRVFLAVVLALTARLMWEQFK